jgi:hypothetical protein
MIFEDSISLKKYQMMLKMKKGEYETKIPVIQKKEMKLSK